jgi:hypothetical protein
MMATHQSVVQAAWRAESARWESRGGGGATDREMQEVALALLCARGGGGRGNANRAAALVVLKEKKTGAWEAGGGTLLVADLLVTYAHAVSHVCARMLTYAHGGRRRHAASRRFARICVAGVEGTRQGRRRRVSPAAGQASWRA